MYWRSWAPYGIYSLREPSKWVSGLRGNDGSRKRKQKRKHGKYCACSQVPLCTEDLTSDAALAHVFFESVSAPVLSGTQLPRFPYQGRSFSRLFSRSFVMLVLLTHVLLTHVLFLCIIEFSSLAMLCLYCWLRDVSYAKTSVYCAVLRHVTPPTGSSSR